MNHITAIDLDSWGNEHSARGEIPALIRRLIHETVQEPPKICDFRSGAGIDLPEPDGTLDAVSGNSWVPTGYSVWELSTSKNIEKKANEDIGKRTDETNNEKRSSTTFLFVTPRRWPGKQKWIEQAKSNNVGWKDIRAYDAFDLEQWLETDQATTVWFHETQLGNSVDGIQSLSRAWEEWSQATKPEFPLALMCASRDDVIEKLYKFLGKPAEHTMTVVGNTREEAVAFIAAALKKDERLREIMIDGLIIHDEKAAARISSETKKTAKLLVMASSEIARQMPILPGHSHVLIAEARGNIQIGAGESNTIFLHRILLQDFNELVEKHGFVDAHSDARQLARKIGHSLSALRRKFAKNDALKNPPWAKPEIAKNLFPLALIGGWNENYKGDKDVIEHLAQDYEKFSNTAQSLMDAEEAPLEKVGAIFKLRSRLDTFAVLGQRLTADNMDKFFATSKTILSLADPSFTLPPEDRWAANIYNKERQHSSFLRNGITDTLILFAISEDGVLPPGLHAKNRVDNLVRDLLQHADKERWYALRDILPSLAEASPDVFLEALEIDLRQTEPSISSLFSKEEDILIGFNYQYGGLLHALEVIAWHPDRLIAVVRVLGQLMRLFENRIMDNFYSRLRNSLVQILKSRMPQTAAKINQRLKAWDFLCSEFPRQGAEIAVEFVSSVNSTGHYSDRPRWRDDAQGFGEPKVSQEDRAKMEQAMVEKLLDIIASSNFSSEETLRLCTQIISHIDSLGLGYSLRLFKIIGDKWSTWNNEGQVSLQKEMLLHLHWYALKGDSGYDKNIKEALKKFYETLEFRNPAQKHAWLFVHRPPFPDKYIQDIEEEHAEAVKCQQSAITEIFSANGHAGIVELCELQVEVRVVSDAVRESIRLKNVGALNLTELVREAVQSNLDEPRLADFLSRLFWGEEPNYIIKLARAVCRDDMPLGRRTALLHAIPLSQETWEYVNGFGSEQVDAYWGKRRNWTPELEKPEILKHVVKEYLGRRLPRLAFDAADKPADYDPEQLLEILEKWGTREGDADRTPSDPDIWQLKGAVEHLNGKIQDKNLYLVECKFYEILKHSGYEAKTIYKALSREPREFVNLLLEYSLKRRAARTATAILFNWKDYLPGQQENGVIDSEKFQEWINTARKLCEENGIKGAGDETIGKILAYAPAGSDGLYPCEPVRELIEENNQDILIGFEVGILNSRGVTTRSLTDGGEQERELVEKYNNLATRLSGKWPHTSRVMRQIADSYEAEAQRHDDDTRIMNLRDYD